MGSTELNKRSTDIWTRKGYSLSELQDCPFCGGEIPAEDTVCYYCKSHIGKDPNKGVYTSQKAGKTWRLIKYAGAFIAVFGISSLFLAEKNLPFGMLFSISGLSLFSLGRVGHWWCSQ